MEMTDQTQKILIFLLSLFLTWAVFQVNRFVFKRIYRIRKMLYLRYLERVLAAVILVGGTVCALSSFGGLDMVWKTAVGGTAFVSAVLLFAAQDVIKDNLAGLMISIYKPFEIGNRVQLEDGTAGIIRDITMRHVVLQLQDTQVIVIPNSKLNSMSIRNFSYLDENRSALFQFHISYNSDVEKAMQVIGQAVRESQYSLAGKMTGNGAEYGPVYFMAMEDSSFLLTTTVYYGADVPSEVVISDINLRVTKALKKHGIEIPYPYMNVVQKEE